MKIAIASSNGENVDLHLGKAYSLYIYEYDDEGITLLEHRILELEDDKHQGGKVIQACEDCDVIISVEDGNRLLAENQRTHFLDKYAVVFMK